jgi:hypothetical protein
MTYLNLICKIHTPVTYHEASTYTQKLIGISSRIKLSRKTEDEKKKIKGDIEERIKTLRHSIKQVGFNNC